MGTLGATLVTVAPGRVEIAINPTPAISPQRGFVHAGAVSAIADTAAGYGAQPYAAGSGRADGGVQDQPSSRPAVGECILARGAVVKAGRTLTLARAEVFAESEGRERLIHS